MFIANANSKHTYSLACKYTYIHTIYRQADKGAGSLAHWQAERHKGRKKDKQNSTKTEKQKRQKTERQKTEKHTSEFYS